MSDPEAPHQAWPIVALTSSTESNTKYCWVCFATDEENVELKWVQPCKCSGTTKWVHQSCLQRWVDEKQKDDSFRRVYCPQCQTEYLIVFPPVSFAVVLLDSMDHVIRKISPVLAAGIVVMSMYWTAVTYGAITVMQVIGHKEGMQLMEFHDPLVILVSLPAIPIALVLGKMLRWEEFVLVLIRRHRSTIQKIPIVRTVLPPESESSVNIEIPDLPPLADPVSATRVLCGALILPTIAVLVGRLLFDHVEDNLQRTFLGGAAFVIFKGLLKIFHKQQMIFRKSKRKILDYIDENIVAYANTVRYDTFSFTGSDDSDAY